MIYRINLESVLLRVRFPRCIHAAKVQFGDAGELIVEDILQQGHTLMSQVCDDMYVVSPTSPFAGSDIVDQTLPFLCEGAGWLAGETRMNEFQHR